MLKQLHQSSKDECEKRFAGQDENLSSCNREYYLQYIYTHVHGCKVYIDT